MIGTSFRNSPRAWVAPLLILLLASVAHAQGTRSDYERARNLRDLTGHKVFKNKVEAHWFGDNTQFWYRNELSADTWTFVLVDATAGTRQPAFDHERLAAALSKATGQALAAERLPLDHLGFSGSALRLDALGKHWRCDLQSYAIDPAATGATMGSTLPELPAPHPSGPGGAETEVTFTNATKANISIYWIDLSGRRQRYATVRAGDQWNAQTYAQHVWLVTDAAGKTLAVVEATADPATVIIDGQRHTPPAPPPEAALQLPGPHADSPDGRFHAFTKDCNVWVHEKSTGQEFKLSSDGQANDAYEDQFFWAPDSTRLVALRTSAGQEHKVYFVESSPKKQLQPKLHTIDYLKPGDQIPLSRPHLFNVVAKAPIPINESLFPNPWSVSDIRWEPEGRRFTFLYNQRGHQVLRIVAVDGTTGAASALVDEQSKTFIDYDGKVFCRYLADTHEIIWMSERDGWNHLYLYDAQSGQVKNQITRGPWVVRRVDRVDTPARQIWFQAGGMIPAQDPYYIHFCRVNFDGTGLVDLTPGDGTHHITYSPDQRYFIDSWSRVDCPPVIELRRTSDGTLVCNLEKADWTPLRKTGWQAPERFVAKGRDGTTDIYGVICRPTNFQRDRQYPVLEDIYAGPQDSFVPKSFSPCLGMQEIAELGFIVVQIDGMGTSNRSKAFHDVCWKNLGDAGFPDRILWLKAAAAKYQYMDLTRLGIYGGSAGGQSALRALLAHGDFYKAAVADCGCHDNRMDKIWWNELWMGWPVGPHYAAQSNVTEAAKLQGQLLLMVGELDDNVDPASTMQVVNALVKADKDFELLVLPGHGHGVMGTTYGRRRMEDFFVRNLLHVVPRSTP